MTTHAEPNDRQPSRQSADAPEGSGSKRRLFLLVGLLALALFALWYDYKVARPAVEQAYERIAATNEEINSASEHRRMTNVDVQSVLRRTPSDTFVSGKFTVEAYRWNAGMPIEFRGLSGDESPGIGLKTHNYYAVYRKDGPELAFVTHYKFDLDSDDLEQKQPVAPSGDDALDEQAAGGMADYGSGPAIGGGPGGPGGDGPGGEGGGPGGGRGFDPEAMFAERDVDGDGKLTGDEISERMRESLEAIDTDGDGAISKDEFLARMSQVRGRGGRGGSGGEGGAPGQGPGGGGEGRRQRPPLEANGDAPATEAATSDASPAAESTEAPAETATESAATEPVADTLPQTNGDVPKEAESSEP
ncbi:MAG TPA: EF-hand domain-containing protein [Pirellulaceae bacterium]|nr:EF-hand domain-containing protein [Pirellulaceae bacterium]